jgi:hypothetical protein
MSTKAYRAHKKYKDLIGTADLTTATADLTTATNISLEKLRAEILKPTKIKGETKNGKQKN